MWASQEDKYLLEVKVAKLEYEFKRRKRRGRQTTEKLEREGGPGAGRFERVVEETRRVR